MHRVEATDKAAVPAVWLERRFAKRGHSSAGKIAAEHDPNLNPGGGGAGA